MQAVSHGRALRTEAQRTNERRVLVLTGTADACYEAAERLLDTLPVGIRDTLVISERTPWTCERIDPSRSARVMGRTKQLLVLDLHDAAVPNTIGRATGAVDGGGLFVLLCPPLDQWPACRDAFDERLAVEPFDLEDVRGGFKEHLVDTLRTHPGIGIVDVSQDAVVTSGCTGAQEKTPAERTPTLPPTPRFPVELYRHCQSADQIRVLRGFEQLFDAPSAVLVTAERGRGKSSVAGIAAIGLAASGYAVGITAPAVENVRTAFDRGVEVADDLDLIASHQTQSEPRIHTDDGAVVFLPSADVASRIDEFDVVLVDEAAGMPVPILDTCLECDRVGCTTTLYGYEGSGQGFAQRFRRSLESARHAVTEYEMQTPIRYAPNDPIESWLNHALLLDAAPPVDEAVAATDPASATYHRWAPVELLDEPATLRRIMGLLATAHYRTEPDDLARILDAPNLEVTTLRTDGTVVAVALIAREGNLPEDVRTRAYRGERLRGNMLPDIFINDFREPAPAARSGLRLVRIATHRAARRRGLASTLLDEIMADLGHDMDWIGTGFGVTPDLVEFWHANGFVPTLLGTTRNRASGVNSIVMMHRSSGRLVDRHGDQLPRRLRGSLSDIHRDLDPDLVLAVFRVMSADSSLVLSEPVWRSLTAAAVGPGRYDLDPEPARRLVIHHLTTTYPSGDLTDRQARILVRKILQGHPWQQVADAFDYPSAGQAGRAIGAALDVLITEHGGRVVAEERERLGVDR